MSQTTVQTDSTDRKTDEPQGKTIYFNTVYYVLKNEELFTSLPRLLDLPIWFNVTDELQDESGMQEVNDASQLGLGVLPQ